MYAHVLNLMKITMKIINNMQLLGHMATNVLSLNS